MYCACNENMAGQLNIISCQCARNTANCRHLHYIKKCNGLTKISNCNYFWYYFFLYHFTSLRNTTKYIHTCKIKVIYVRIYIHVKFKFIFLHSSRFKHWC